MVEELTAKFQLLVSGPKSWNMVASSAGQLHLDWVVSGAGFVLRPERSRCTAVNQKMAAAGGAFYVHELRSAASGAVGRLLLFQILLGWKSRLRQGHELGLMFSWTLSG